MAIFFHILSHNILPIFALISLGFLLSKKFTLDIFSFSKLLFYLFVPAFIFVNLYTTAIHWNMVKVFLCGIALLAVHDGIGRIVARVRGYNVGLTSAFKNAIMFNNSGNIGLSLITLIFTSAPFVVDGKTPYLEEAITAQIMILVLQNITTNTIGFFNAGRAKGSFKDSVTQIFAMPAIYVVPSALILQQVDFDLTGTAIWPALEYLKNGLVPMSLLTLGVQLSRTKFDFRRVDAHLAVFTKLVIAPVLAMICIYFFGFQGATAQTVLIAYSVPTAVNTALIAVECDSYPNFAAQAVTMSTVLSAVTLTLAIYVARIMYPV